jgi:6-phosphogluconolactonase
MAVWHQFDDRKTMVAELKAAVERVLSDAIAEKGRASWAVSGGSTPAPLFEAMQNSDLTWGNVDVALVDERWVEKGHPRSNEAFVERHLKAGKASVVQVTGMKTEHKTAVEAVKDLNKRYEPFTPFDSILLGVGPDGHTASLFPDALGLEAAFDLSSAPNCVALTAKQSPVTGEEVERMSLSASAIAQSKHVVVMITGAEKKQVLEAALEAESELPVGRLYSVKPFEIYWAP